MLSISEIRLSTGSGYIIIGHFISKNLRDFTKKTLKSDMDALISKQKEDGRRDTWYGIGEGTILEWAGIQTLSALKILKNTIALKIKKTNK